MEEAVAAGEGGNFFLMANVLIQKPEQLERAKAAFKEGGADSIHVVADFDHTLTKTFIDGEKQPTVIAQIRHGNYLTPDYAPQAFALHEKYGKLDRDFSLTLDERIAKMHEWWSTHFALLVECGLNKEVLEHIVENRPNVYREGVLEWIDMLHEAGIPLVILSAGPGDMIDMYLKKVGRLYDTVHVVANRYRFDEHGNVTGIYEPIIHSLNKEEAAIHGQSFYSELLQRKNVILLGDNLGDIQMTKGFPFEHQIAIGFLNEEIEERKDRYLETFDMVITDDGDFIDIHHLTKECI